LGICMKDDPIYSVLLKVTTSLTSETDSHVAKENDEEGEDQQLQNGDKLCDYVCDPTWQLVDLLNFAFRDDKAIEDLGVGHDGEDGG